MQVDTSFLDIIMKPEYKDYREVCMIVRGKPYLVKFPIGVRTVYIFML